MQPVFQVIINPRNGDCLRACVASLLELPLDAVPNFLDDMVKGHSAIQSVNRWLAKFNLAFFETQWQWDNGCWFALDNVYCIFSVPSQKFAGSYHAVVGRFSVEEDILKWQIVHDPNPYNTPYPDDVEIERVSFLVKCCT